METRNYRSKKWQRAEMRAVSSFSILLILFVFSGCGPIEKQIRAKKTEEFVQKMKAYLESLPRCTGAEWFNECEPNFLPDFRKVIVFVEEHVLADGKLNEEEIDLVKTSVKDELGRLGYKVDFGRNIPFEEFDKEVYICSVADKTGNDLLEVKHNRPLFEKLIREDPGLRDYDVLLFLEYDIGSIGYQQEGAKIRYQLYDVGREKMVFWSHYHSSDSKEKKTGTTYTKKIGNESYLATPYWFVGSNASVLKGALKGGFKYLPDRSSGKVLPQEFDGFLKWNCKVYDAVLIWN